MNKSDSKHKVKYRESKAIVDESIYIKQMIRNNINSFFEFVPISSEVLFKISMLSDKQIKIFLENMKLISQYPNNFLIQSSNEYISLILYLIIFFIESQDLKTSTKFIHILFDGIIKLYSIQKFYKEELLLIALFIIVISIEPRREMYCKSIKTINFTDIFNKKIMHYDVFYLSLDLVVKINDKDITSNYCDFCLRKVFKNKTNIFYIANDARILSLLQITSSNKQIELLSRLYMNKYSKSLLGYFLKNIKIALESPNDTIKMILPVLKNQTELLNQINKEEVSSLNKDSIKINRGFVMNDTSSNGLFVNGIKIKNQFTLLFSFNYSPNAICVVDSELPIIILKADSDNENKISFSIEKGELCADILDYKNKQICEIKPYTPYIVYFSMKDRDQFTLSIKSQEYQWLIKNTTKIALKKEFTMQIGYDGKINFEGFIGSILMFRTIFYDDFRINSLALKGNYDNIFYLPLYETTHIDKYNKELNNPKEDISEYRKALLYFKTNKDTIKNMICFISPPFLNELERKNKKSFKNSYFKDTVLNFKTEPLIQNEGTFVFENKNMIFEFLKYEGIYLLILNYELYIKLISLGNLQQEVYDLIEKNICCLFDFTIEIFNHINSDLYIKEIKKLVFSMQKYVQIISETSKLNGELFLRLNKWLILLSIQSKPITCQSDKFLLILRNQFAKFLLDSSLYNLKDYETLQTFFSTFVNCIDNKKEGLANDTVMKSFLQFGKMFDYHEPTIEFKKVKILYNEAISKYLKLTKKPRIYLELYYTFYNKFDIGYREYQMIQIFYLNADYFYSNIDDNIKQKISKYFIELLEYFDDKNKSKLVPRQKEIIRAICIRIILEYPLNDYFYFNDEKKRKSVKQHYLPIESYSNSFPNTNHTDKLSLMPTSLGNSSNSMSSYNEGSVEEELIMKFLERYSTFEKVCDNIKNPSDYLIKTLLLSIFDKGNLTPQMKLKFIKKANDYNGLNDYDFVTLNDYTIETKRYLLLIVSVIERNKEKLLLAYQIFLYLIMKIGNERKFKKDRNESICVFNHFVSSKKICGNVFINTQYNTNACYLLQGEFCELIQMVLPYHKSSFLFYFVKSLILVNGNIQLGFFFLNLLLKFQHSNKTTKYFFYSQIALAQLLYEIFREKRITSENIQSLDHVGLFELLKSELTKTRFNILQNIPNCKRKKTYLEVLFDVIMKVIKYSKNKTDYEYVLTIIFGRDQKDDPCYQNDLLYYSSNYRNFHLNNMFSKQYDKIKFTSMTLHFLMKYLTYSTSENKLEFMTENLVGIILDLSGKAFVNAKLIFKEHSECRKSSSKNSKLYNVVVELVNYAVKNNNVGHNNIFYMLKETMIKDKIDVKRLPEWLMNPIVDNSFSLLFNSKEALDNSFNSCNSTKSQKSRCILRRKIVEKRKQNNHLNISNLIEEDSELEIVLRQSTLLDLSSINFSDEVIMFPKDSLLLKIFGIYFKDAYFNNEEFKAMKMYYMYQFSTNSSSEQRIRDTSINYPTCLKNYIPYGLYFKGLFLRQDLDFFHDTLFQYTHKYYMERLNKSAKYSKRLFPPKRKTGLMVPLMKGEKGIPFYCELITNHCVIFGRIKVYNTFLFFENLNKETESATLDENNKFLFLYSSYENDYSARAKKIHIFKRDISQIMIRRFLYLFQACEIYLFNGKSYYFNFFTEGKKSEFFQSLDQSKIEIIVDPKEVFRSKEFTKKWLNGQLTNLDYLLIVNHYALRSYNDINQYPVVPWVTLSLMKDRNLKFTTVAQTQKQQSYLSERFSALDRTFNAHYNTHFSNSSFVLYYLVRLNPFTNNQVNLQVNKLETPNRQFHSINETIEILERAYDSRELIPEFFLTVEFFYNINYVFFGHRTRDNRLIHNIIPINQMCPIDYIFYHKTKINSQYMKNNLNYFIDNIFGCQQMKEHIYNTYDKYCYQGIISLTEKTQKYIAKDMDTELIKDKIGKKINKIISFGQTPLKLLEDHHPVWIPENVKIIEEESDDNDNGNALDFTKLFQEKKKKQINLNNKILNISMLHINKKHLLYGLVKLKKAEHRYGIKILETSFRNDKSKPIPIPKKINMLEKINITDSIQVYKYNPKYVMIDFQMIIFVICRFTDNSFMIINQNGEMKCILTDSFVSCILKISKRSFITGHRDGKICEWEIKAGIDNSFQIVDDMIFISRTCLAQESQVCAIHFDSVLGILITSGREGVIYIRKYFDLGILSVIDIKSYFLYEIKLNNNFLYTLLYNEGINKYIIKVFTLNGLELAKSDYEYYNNIDIDDNGNIIAGFYTENKVKVLTPSLRTITFFSLDFNDKTNIPTKGFLNLAYMGMGKKKIVCVLSPDLLLKQSLTDK